MDRRLGEFNTHSASREAIEKCKQHISLNKWIAKQRQKRWLKNKRQEVVNSHDHPHSESKRHGESEANKGIWRTPIHCSSSKLHRYLFQASVDNILIIIPVYWR